MAALTAVAKEHGLKVIEDNAQSLGAVCRMSDGASRYAGTIGEIGCTSFFPSKVLGCYGDGGAVFTDDNGWYICAAGAVSYYDYASGQTMTLCAQPGCSHGDASCQAWVGNVNSFAVLDGVLYATLDNAGSGAQLVRKELSGGKVTVLEQWDNTDDHFYTATLGRFSCGKATLHLECRITEQQADGRVESRTEGSSLLYDLAAGSYRELSVPGTLMGFSARWGAVVETPEEQSLLSEEEFTAQYGEDASYGRYLHQNIQRRLLLWDMESGDYTVVADHNKDGYIMTADPAQVYGMEHIYQCGDQLRLLNLESGESRTLLTMEDIIHYWVMDSKAFIITETEAGYRFWVADLQDGKPVELVGATNEHGIAMSPFQEGGSFFRALGDNGQCVISKEDFYAVRFENAVDVG